MLVANIAPEHIHVQLDESGEPINPRGPVRDTKDLQQSITTVGFLIEPLVVRWMPGAKETAYLLVHGHRRLKAVKALGWKTVPCHVLPHQSTPEDDMLYMLAADTNESYPPLYLAKAFARLRDAGRAMKDIANAWGKTPDQVSAHIQLLEAAQPAQAAVMDGRMGMSVFSLVKHLPPAEQAEIINGAGGNVSMRYVKEQMRQRRDAQAAAPSANGNGTETAVSAPDRTVKGEYHKALAAVRSVKQAMQDGRLPASYDDWPADVKVLHAELLSALDSIRPFGGQPDAPKRKPAPVFL
jgi:ParB/RepB/Spo0J family partition protein